jgi:hypothetical protein
MDSVWYGWKVRKAPTRGPFSMEEWEQLKDSKISI